jgi:hypothetical protein
MLHLVTYDLKQPGQNYTPLYDAIKSLGAWWHYLESVWLVKTAHTASQVSAVLRPHIDSNDRLLIVDITGDTNDGWLPQDAWNWISSNING